MPTLDQNRAAWNGFDWSQRGEDWSVGWGNSTAQWNFSWRPRLFRHFPADTILEIATGYGRWTKFLVNEARVKYLGFDLMEKCAAYCRDTYGAPGRSFVSNDGLHLVGVPDRSIDLIVSLDSLVHVDWAILQSYLAESLRVLKPGGFALLHHSNAGGVQGFAGFPNEQKQFRAEDCSAQRVREEVARLGGGVVGQELVNWGPSGENLIDCFSTFTTSPVAEPKIVHNSRFMKDMGEIRQMAALYSP